MNLKMLKAVIAGLILSVSSIANAGLINVSYLEITNAKGDWLQVGEVIANDMFNNDVALTGFATATAPHQWSAISGPEKAIDGITLGNYNLGQIFHEQFKGSTLTVTFDSLQDLSSIQIFGRTDCCSSRDIYNVSFYGEDSNLIATYTDIAPGVSIDVPEPSTLAIFALGIMGLAGRRFKK
ncbi:PEP-CTERM sorting domain-containing protein [Colwellia demingiae]|uniref:PEP-CTERM sorting domain-containing protein n=1 Tax=Colwellia demingiae TaxID=89401 RepID=UPI001FEBF755|nr:PEP-CTERM sorting domain-containing protein [Colwellia demingiae]